VAPIRAELPLFAGTACRAFEMGFKDAPRLQAFLEANPEYYFAVGGVGPRPTEAREEFEYLPPAEMPFRKMWLLEFRGDDEAMAGMATVASDLMVEHVWHLGLFIVATSLHGHGAAQDMYGALESWMRAQGARWSRLGVVQGNLRAERFWEAQGYAETRTRILSEPGRRTNTVRVMAKPLAGGSIAEYLSLVARDRPESP
jgi:GNAT superfamily N-acetyltransferase